MRLFVTKIIAIGSLDWYGEVGLQAGSVQHRGVGEVRAIADGLASQRPPAAARLGYVVHFVLTYSGQQS